MALAPALRERLARLADSSEKPPALVFECSYVNGLSAIRSLARIGAPVVALDHRRDGLGMRSRLALGVVGPPPGERERFAEHLSQVCDALGREAVAFPTHDDYLVAVNDAAPGGAAAAVRPARADRSGAGEALPVRGGRAGRRAAAGDVPPGVRRAGTGGGGRHPLPGGDEAVAGQRVQGALREAADRGHGPRRAGGRLPAGRAVPADVPGADTGRRRLPVDGGQLSGRRGAGAGRVLRQEAAAGAGRGWDLPRGRSGVGRGRGFGGTAPVAGAGVPRHLPGRVQARSTGRVAAADGGERAALAVALAGIRLRRGSGGDRLPGRAGPARDGGDQRASRAQALGGAGAAPAGEPARPAGAAGRRWHRCDRRSRSRCCRCAIRCRACIRSTERCAEATGERAGRVGGRDAGVGLRPAEGRRSGDRVPVVGAARLGGGVGVLRPRRGGAAGAAGGWPAGLRGRGRGRGGERVLAPVSLGGAGGFAARPARTFHGGERAGRSRAAGGGRAAGAVPGGDRAGTA